MNTDAPLKLFIKDLCKIENHVINGQTSYVLYDVRFKKFTIRGIVTKIFSMEHHLIKFQLSDVTGSTIVCFQRPDDTAKLTVTENKLKQTEDSAHSESLYWMFNSIYDRRTSTIKIGDCVMVTGKMITDIVFDERAVLAFECDSVSLESDSIWMMDLVYLYKNHYRKTKSNTNQGITSE